MYWDNKFLYKKRMYMQNAITLKRACIRQKFKSNQMKYLTKHSKIIHNLNKSWKNIENINEEFIFTSWDRVLGTL